MTVWVRIDEVLGLKFPSPLYTTVIEWVATDKSVVLKVAWPLPLSNRVPRTDPPSLNVTVLLGVPVPGAAAVIVAVNVTDWPNTIGLVEEVTVPVVLAGLTVWSNGEAVLSLPVKLLLPL